MTAPRQDVQAVAKTVHVSARKARLVVDQIRGRSVPEARTILAFSTRAAARDVEKVLRSAVANAEMNPNRQWNGDDLYVKAAFVDEGVTIKRWRARARGRVNRIKKRTCHITIVVAESPRSGRPRPQKPARPAAEQAPKPDAGTVDEPAAEEKPKRRSPAKKKEGAAV